MLDVFDGDSSTHCFQKILSKSSTFQQLSNDI